MNLLNPNKLISVDRGSERGSGFVRANAARDRTPWPMALVVGVIPDAPDSVFFCLSSSPLEKPNKLMRKIVLQFDWLLSQFFNFFNHQFNLIFVKSPLKWSAINIIICCFTKI